MVLKPKVIYNPTAGKGYAGKHLAAVEALLKEHGVEYDLALTEAPGQALELAQQAAAEGRELVVAAGGDGTVNEALNGLMAWGGSADERPALGMLPIGRGNDFAFCLGVPHNAAVACEILARGARRRVDVGRVMGGNYPNGRFFGNGLGMGFDTVVGFEAAKMKLIKGTASYLAGVVKTIFLYAKAPVYEVTLDGKTETKPYLLISVMNGRRMGGAFLMAPDGQPDDGVFDLCLAGQVSQLAMLPLASTFMTGKQGGHPAVEMTHARTVRVKAVEGTIPAHADGETICAAGLELTIDLIPRALDVVALPNGRETQS